MLDLFAPAPHGACFAPAKAHRRPLRGRASIRNTEMLAVPRAVGHDPLETPKESVTWSGDWMEDVIISVHPLLKTKLWLFHCGLSYS